MEINKLYIAYIAEPFSCLVNKLFTSSGFSKVARVFPIFKSGNNAEFINLTISILPSFSKMFEKLINNLLLKYLSKHLISFPNQYGCRNNRDTSMAVKEMINKITTAMDLNAYSIGIFIDLSKAFDTLNHNILVNKLEHYVVRGRALEWFKSYLHNRSECVEFNGSQSARFGFN